MDAQHYYILYFSLFNRWLLISFAALLLLCVATLCSLTRNRVAPFGGLLLSFFPASVFAEEALAYVGPVVTPIALVGGGAKQARN